ncbi:MAG: hypothetical protein J1F09_08045 [Oscillospiraceae bacterium]|nr:hypothetical protein [Oscillospiraceae bacterium]
MTNAQIINIINVEARNMRQNIEICTLRPTQTGVYVHFRAQMGENRFGTMEYALIGGMNFYRIQKPENVISRLRADKRLYN